MFTPPYCLKRYALNWLLHGCRVFINITQSLYRSAIELLAIRLTAVELTLSGVLCSAGLKVVATMSKLWIITK